MKREETDNLEREYVGISPTVVLKCKSTKDKNYTNDKEYKGVSDQRMYNGMYTSHRVEGNNHTSVLLTIERLMDTFAIVVQ